jgi:hypothetical protein
MQQKASNELNRVQRHGLGLVAVRIILPQEGDLAAFNRQNPAVGDRNPVRVAGEIFQNLLRAAERRFGVYDPFDSPGPVAQGRECSRSGQTGHLPMKA